MTSQNMIQLTFTLLFLCLQHWSAALTCTDMSCHLDDTEYNKAINNHNTVNACRLLNSTSDCLKYLLDGCEENVDWMKMYYTSTKSYFVQIQHFKDIFCNHSPSPILCSDIGLCTRFVEQTQVAIETDKDKQACGSIQESVRCLRGAVADCSQGDVIEPAALDNYTATLKYYEKWWSEICLNVYSVQGQVVTSVRSLSVNSENNVCTTELSTQLMLLSGLYVIFTFFVTLC